MSNFGSKHRVTRRFVQVDEIKQIDPSNSDAPVVVAYFGESDAPLNSSPASEEE